MSALFTGRCFFTMSCTGTLFIVSAPSGAGKTSLVKKLREDLPGLAVSVSHTTRPRRVGEVDGEDYWFVTHETFQAMLAHNAFLEHARVFDHYYGTAQENVERLLQTGHDVILEIDWQGARQVRDMLPESLSIFILPPSIAVLEQRLRQRAQDSDAVIARRMQAAVAEMSHYDEFDYLIVNDEFAQALFELKAIITAQRVAAFRQRQNLTPLLSALFDGAAR